MVKSSRAIIVHNEKILLIHRIKNDMEYYVLPGGKIEENETQREAVIREVKEETNLTIEIDKLLWRHNEHIKINKHNEKIVGYYFLAKKFKGELMLGGPEKELQSKNNIFLLNWYPINELKEILMYPIEIKQKIINLFGN
ncbi:NUDIX domain-containing protein [archaeon]|jgi:8-oxo-dGTP diphosphatase|nr:NUDIX domain-containing protein [archaeon]MBT3450575.1 NUDIX domain-containing protein [archaeon]MBT6868429.1 NUDIX domain-containing protein [archaeon]MBT7193528.1 NUDIX domain-containing protein [archaeon]MBT7381277.1 NUDIX domain-containing protein [archaeon]